MYHRDGTLLARYPHIEAMIGKNFATGQMHREILSRSDHGTMRLSSPLDGLDRLASVRTLAGFPVSIIATTTVAAALADWREQTRYLVAVAGFSVLVIAVILLLVVRKLSQQHQLEKQRLDTAVNNIPQGLVVYDALARVTVCNRRYLEMFGLSPDVAKPGCSMQDLISHRKETGSFDGDVEEFCAAIIRNVRLGKVTHQITEAPGGRSILIINQPLEAGGWVATIEDITERRRSEERITHLAHYDALTNLPNRALFHGSQCCGRAIGGALHRHRRIQERQRYAWTSDRRRIAEVRSREPEPVRRSQRLRGAPRRRRIRHRSDRGQDSR